MKASSHRPKSQGTTVEKELVYDASQWEEEYMLTMCVELSRNASIQFGIKSWPVVPSGVCLLEILNILKSAVTEIVLLDCSHLERTKLKVTQGNEGSQGDNATKDETTPTAEDCEYRAFDLSCRIINQSAIATKKYMVPPSPGIPILSYPAPTPASEKTVKPQDVGVCRLVCLGSQSQMLARACLHQ